MRRRQLAAFPAALALILTPGTVGAKEGSLQLRFEGTNAVLQIYGDPEADWRIQTSSNLAAWATLTNFGPLLSARTNPPARVLGGRAETGQFYRAIKTAGLYDPTLLRTISLTFTQANWSNAMVSARTYETNVYCPVLWMDNGATNYGVGARFRGNTSFTGMGPGGGPLKKSIALEIDYGDTNANLMGYDSLNLNNAYLDETLMREALYFTVMRQYAVCPAGCLAQLYINGANRGVYSHAQQQNNDLIREYFPSDSGDRWRAPNMDGNGALNYLGNTNVSTYTNHYTLKSAYHSQAWPRLINAIYVLNNTPAAQLRNKVEEVLAVDRWLWFLVLENVFADDDSYWNKGSDYMMYYEPESGRLHPIEHDGNEAFVVGDYALSPTAGSTTRPVLVKLLSVPELRQRYFAHMRTVLQESYHPAILTPLIQQFHAVSIAAIIADPYKGYTSMATYTNDLNNLKMFVTNRYNYLMNHADLAPVPPTILEVSGPAALPAATEIPFVTARVQANGTNGLSSVWLYYRGRPYGRFAVTQMLDDGQHGDGAANDGIFGASTTNYPAGTKVRYYVEARSANAAQAAAFAPSRAEEVTYSYRVALTTASDTPVVINEIMASNSSTVPDPQGEYDDWIELHNISSQPVDLSGWHLSDEPYNPRKWAFPPGTIIPADGYLLVWADEDTTDTPGLHASFKLSASGEEVYLADTDTRLNVVLDRVTFGPQQTDRSYGRTAANEDVWAIMTPTPGRPNE